MKRWRVEIKTVLTVEAETLDEAMTKAKDIFDDVCLCPADWNRWIDAKQLRRGASYTAAESNVVSINRK